MFTSISGRSVLVTGGTKGIGKGLAAHFAAEGAKVVITGRDSDTGKQAAADLSAAADGAAPGGQVSFLRGDVSDAESCAAVVGTTLERHGGLDVVCCNAGIFPAASLDGVTINAIMPGNIATEGLDDLGPDYLRSMEAAIPLRHLGSVADIANAALFFASDEAGYITGQTLVIDGGQTIPESLEAMG